VGDGAVIYGGGPCRFFHLQTQMKKTHVKFKYLGRVRLMRGYLLLSEICVKLAIECKRSIS
jgi:hypothetical protein